MTRYTIDAVTKIVDELFDNNHLQASPIIWCRLREIKNMMTDVVEVVRCKDCKYHGATIEEQPTPSIMCAHMHDNDYCSYGERREDE